MLDRPVFNAWHADVANSSACDLIFRQALGLPAEVVSNSLLTWAGLAEVTAALRLAPGQTLVDLACGRGGYSREVARRTGARLIGLDFSAVAVTIAARSTGQRERAGFFVGDFTAIGLRDHSAGAVMCVDAIQFSDPPLAALGECRRILARGGRHQSSKGLTRNSSAWHLRPLCPSCSCWPVSTLTHTHDAERKVATLSRI